MKFFSPNKLAVFCMLASSFLAHAQSTQTKGELEMSQGYYVVIGAYSPKKEGLAQHFVNEVNKSGVDGQYGYNAKKNLLFVYIHYSENFKASLDKMYETRKTTSFNDAWVFVCKTGPGKDDQARAKEEVSKETKESQPTSLIDQLDPSESQKQDENSEQVTDSAAMMNENKADADIADREEDRDSLSLSHYPLLINLYNGRNHADVEGEIKIIDTERAKLLRKEDGGHYISLSDPENGSGEITLLCDIFGYRKKQKEINYYNPLQDTLSEDIELRSDAYVVNFELVRYHIGDIVTMFNVHFYKDAALMRPESRYEINSLLEMLKENDGYKIKIHGHTNGRSPGKIISKGNSSEFFGLNDQNKESIGSAKELSKQRALTIKEYLLKEGIDEERVEIKAWGGRRMLYDKNSPQAKENVRVEVEILAE
ncbi:OmpA family protein [Fulvivirga sediminis]|uniref:OmpA family protein n=1 Tax=Fulvivirga sediminis TaxID=2803949 RepID=A0A937F5Q8_9BACT|nr:OmpA family protein [Fulvivirga sediminis]MBL3656255.1 OmpA family protein [Fulvivirga sediminis]